MQSHGARIQRALWNFVQAANSQIFISSWGTAEYFSTRAEAWRFISLESLHQISSWFREIVCRSVLLGWKGIEWSILDREPHCPPLAVSQHAGSQAFSFSFSGRPWERFSLKKLKGPWHSDIWRNLDKKSILLPSRSMVKPSTWQLPLSNLHVPFPSPLPEWRTSSYPCLVSLLNMNWYPKIIK